MLFVILVLYATFMLGEMEKPSVLVKRNQVVGCDGSGLREEAGWAEQMPLGREWCWQIESNWWVTVVDEVVTDSKGNRQALPPKSSWSKPLCVPGESSDLGHVKQETQCLCGTWPGWYSVCMACPHGGSIN